MINVKDQVYRALCEVIENVSDNYPKDWKNLPAVQLTEEENNVYEYTKQEDKSYIRYRVDLWDLKSTSDYALKIDTAVAALGLRRIACQDANEPDMRHKVLRYEGVVDNKTQNVYQK